MIPFTETHAIIGKKAKINFPEMEAEVSYLSETELRWETQDKDGDKSSGVESVSYKRLTDNLHFINWIEKDGFTVSQVIDSEGGSVKAYWSYADAESSKGQRGAQFVDAKFQLLG